MAGLGTNRTIGSHEKEVIGRLLFALGIVFFLDTFFLSPSFTIQFDFFRFCIAVWCGLWRSPRLPQPTYLPNVYFLQPLEPTLPLPSPCSRQGIV